MLCYDSAYKNPITSSCFAGIEDPHPHGLQVQLYPNPASGFLNIDCSSLQSKIKSICLKDISGRQMVKAEVNALSASSWNIDISKLPPGMYLCVFHTKEGITYTKKVLIKR